MALASVPSKAVGMFSVDSLLIVPNIVYGVLCLVLVLLCST